MIRKQVNTTSPSLYVLGLVCFNEDAIESKILTRKQLALIGWEFSTLILGNAKPDQGDDSTFFKLKLSHQDNPIAFREFIGDTFGDVVREIQFGYYHNRVIVKFSFDQDTKLHVIRSARDKVARIVRQKCFDPFTGKVITETNPPSALNNVPLTIYHIYSHTVIVIPNGIKFLQEESTQVEKMKYDRAYTIKSTSYGFHLPDRWSNKFYNPFRLFYPRRHFIRISPPSTMVYLDGLRLDDSLFANILDAICYGGLYEKYKMDVNRKSGPSDAWSNDLMLSVFQVLMDSVGTFGFNDTSMLINQSALFIGLVAIFISILSMFVN